MIKTGKNPKSPPRDTTLSHVSSVVDVESNVDEKTGGRPLDGDGMRKKIIF